MKLDLFIARKDEGDRVACLVRSLPKMLLLTLALASRSAVAAEVVGAPVDAMIGWSKERPAEGRFVETEQGFMVPYTATIPGTDVRFTMQPIPGGTFTLGSSADEEGRAEDEGPTVEVVVRPFWMAQYELTWAEYKTFMGLYNPLKSIQSTRKLLKSTTDNPRVKSQREKLEPLVAKHPELLQYLGGESNTVDAITVPTPLYDPSATFESGEELERPAVTMSQYAAKQYTKWLSLLIGHDYRLPTEAEWEYACRAATTSRFGFGDDAEQLGDYGWFEGNSDGTTQLVGQKKPNAWGLFDMHGNAMEWVLDAHAAGGYDHIDTTEKAAAEDAIRWPTELYPRVLRGGHWDSSAEECRSAARFASADEEMTGSDPNVPRSPWWFTDYPAGSIGFRLVRPVERLTPEQREKVWEPDVESIRADVSLRVSEGRGVLEQVPANQPILIEQIQKVNSGK